MQDLAGSVAPNAATQVPLIVDLDGTLCRTDTLHEGIFGLIARRPGLILALPLWLRGGKAAFKARIADQHVLDPARLPYDDSILEIVTQARAEGVRTALISASDHRQVQAVADHLGCFDQAVGTGAPGQTINLGGQGKADFLVAEYGRGGFDYLGDSSVDIPVWKAARQAHGVRVTAATRKAAEAEGITLQAAGKDRGPTWRSLIRACRPHQWVKNILILLPVLASQQLSGLPAALLAMLCFSLAASAIYIFNDLVDLPSDRLHPRKRNRPFASGIVSARQGLLMAAGLLILSIGLALFLPSSFLAVLLIYLAATSAYSFWLKRKMMIDVIALATLYTLRIVAGSMATSITLSPWLLVFSMFLFFSLATIKRQAELEDMVSRGVATTLGRNMLPGDLPILQAMSVGAAQAAVLVFALYSQDPKVQSHFSQPDLLLIICPLLFLWLGRMQLLTRRGYMTDDPIVFTFRDRMGLICGGLTLIIFALAAA
ncbi:UbiA family prenyltransferase [Paracoccus sp. TK19116]|uniref:UbiA family prenyltransferase n=1 Tax=Paracoccus albicereus TaxID=2922394 RepID=A0ABT1MPE4_9RHOB|nr:UbiA family prenyltransferase [Paracoccus albicereus]MCQ0970163.1 UbiA family prenyltransferase [Paracoccus albicereus]